MPHIAGTWFAPTPRHIPVHFLGHPPLMTAGPMSYSAASPSPDQAAPEPDIFAGGGEMGALMRATDWTATPLGPTAHWPQSLRTVLNILLMSRSPIFLWWGPELIQFYNDAYR